MKRPIAHCCLPVYGDHIAGYISKGDGVKVHRSTCPNIQSVKDRLIDVYWDEKKADRYYDSDLVVVARDRSFLLTDIVTVVSQCKVTIESVNAQVNHESLTSTIKMSVRVQDLEQLTNLMANIRKIESVIFVERTSH